MENETKIGRITHYFGKVQVAAIELTDGGLAVGEKIRIKGHTTDLTLEVASMQIDRVDVPRAEKGQAVGIRVPDHVRVGDEVLLIRD